MKKKFSTSWKSSKRPGKQRKYKANAPLHLKKKFLGANLSKELRKKYGRKSLIPRKGDVVKIMRGGFKKKTGKVAGVDTKNMKVEVEGIQVKKQDGSKVNVKFNPSFLQVTEINTEDKERNESIGRSKKKAEKQAQVNEAKEDKNAS